LLTIYRFGTEAEGHDSFGTEDLKTRDIMIVLLKTEKMIR